MLLHCCYALLGFVSRLIVSCYSAVADDSKLSNKLSKPYPCLLKCHTSKLPSPWKPTFPAYSSVSLVLSSPVFSSILCRRWSFLRILCRGTVKGDLSREGAWGTTNTKLLFFTRIHIKNILTAMTRNSRLNACASALVSAHKSALYKSS